MSQKSLFTLWGGLFILCAAQGFIPAPAGVLRVFLTALSLCFFLPPALLLRRAAVSGDLRTARLLAWLSGGSLGLTAALLVLNFLTALTPGWLGNFLYAMLVVVSTPMVCSGYWALSLFLWACLLMGSLKALKT